MKYITPTFLVWFIFNISCLGQNPLDASLIADSLKSDADAVIRFSNTTYERKSAEKYSKTVHYAITVLNEKGKYLSGNAVFYDRNSNVSLLNLNMYNSNGILVGKHKKKDAEDYPANQSFTIFSDNRVKVFQPVINTYPYTVEYEYTLEYSGIVGFDIWLPQLGYNIATQRATLKFVTHDDYDIKYKILNHNIEFNKQQSNGLNTYVWSVKNLKAIETEPQIPHYLDIFPTVLLSPNNIEYEGTVGDFSDWNSYGKWVYSLIEGRDDLSEKTVQMVKNITDSISSKREKIKAVYHYMQSKTRYVNIALGIGGFQPMLASEVDEKGYGDCKALSNYTKALLNSIGITSYYAEIGNGSRQMIKFPDFASANQTNHIILCVPLPEDTVWLECTNQSIPFGYIGKGNSDRFALLITKDGGVLAKTPKYTSENNIRNSEINLKLSAEGDADFIIRSSSSNILFEDIFKLLNRSEKEQRDYLFKNLNAEGLSIAKMVVEETTNSSVEGKMYLEGYIGKYAVKTGSRLFIRPNYLLEDPVMESIQKNRKLDIYQAFGFTLKETLSIIIPENYSVEYIPKDTVYQSVYGNYRIHYIAERDKLSIEKEVKINKGTFHEDSFAEIAVFLKNISDRNSENIILVKN
jgi:hypothetical protein